MLRFYDIPDASCYVEPDDGEDGELRWGGTPPQTRLEIQVKGDSVAVSLDLIGSWLAHTPPGCGHA